MIVDHRPDRRALSGADVASIPIGKALVRYTQGVRDALGAAQLGGKKVECFSVRHGCDTKRSVDIVNGMFGCGATLAPILPRQ